MSVGIQVFQLTAAVAIIISAARQNAFGRWRGVQLPAKAALVVSNGVICFVKFHQCEIAVLMYRFEIAM